MKKIKGIIVLVLLLALLASPIAVLASDISDAMYYATIIVTNNGTATTNVAVNVTISTQALIDGGYLNSSANNSVIRSSAGADLPFMPSANADYPWFIWVPSIGKNASIADILYTAESTGGKIRYFPTAEGMETVDSATLELGDNFTVEQSGYWDTDAGLGKYSAYKGEGSAILFVSPSVSENISFAANATQNDWEDEPLIFDDDTATFGTETTPPVGGAWGDFVEFYVYPLSVVEQVRIWQNVSGMDTLDIDLYYGNAWHDGFSGAQGATGAWVVHNVTDGTDVTGARIRYKHDGGAPGNTNTYELDFMTPSDNISPDGYSINPVPLVTATGVASGEHKVQVSGNSAFLGIGIDTGDDTELPVVTDNLVLNIPFWFPSLTGSPFDTVDANELACTVAGATWTADGRQFNGTTDNITIPDDASLRITSEITIEVWVYVLGTHGGGYGGLWWDRQGSARNRFMIGNDGSLLVQFGMDADENFETFGAGSIVTDTWYHIAVTYDGSEIVGWLDTVKGTPSAASGTIDQSSATRYIGVGTTTALFLNGIIGEMRVYNRGLSQAELTLNRNATKWKYIGSYTADDFEYVYSTATVPDTSANWTFLQNNVLPYAGSADNLTIQKILIDGVLQQHIAWQYSTTFSDLSGHSHDATPTFRTESSNDNVSAVLSSFLPISEAKAPSFVLEDAPAFIETVPDIVSEFDVTPPAGTFPLAGVITTIASATDTPPQLPLLIIAVFVIIACSLAVSATMRRYGSGSLIPKIIAITAVMGIFVALENFGIDFWMIFVFLVISIALSMGSKQVGWQ